MTESGVDAVTFIRTEKHSLSLHIHYYTREKLSS